MTSLDFSRSGLRSLYAGLLAIGAKIRRPFTRLGLWLTAHLPKGLYARSLLIIVTPMVLLQSVVAFVFMERHFNQVTLRLSSALAQDIAALWPCGAQIGPMPIPHSDASAPSSRRR